MAIKSFVANQLKGISAQGDLFGQWSNVKQGDTCAPLICPRYSDKSIHIFGNWDGATVSLTGGNDINLTEFEAVYDPDGVDIVQTAARKAWVIYPNYYALKPVLSGGGPATDLTIAIVGRGIL